jgi:hypothetical protein
MFEPGGLVLTVNCTSSPPTLCRDNRQGAGRG